MNSLLDIYLQNAFYFKETDNGLELEIDLPGFEKEEIKVSAARNYLGVKAENGSRKFSKSFKLPSAVSVDDQIDAKYVNGVLTLTFPKSKEQGQKTITVQ